MNKQFLAETNREIADWPDVSISQENAGKHGRIILHYKGESRIVVVANTPGDVRAIKNHIAIVRRELRGMGASKTVAPVSLVQRERNKPNRIAVPTGEAPVQRNPFEALEAKNMNSNAIDAIFTQIEKLRYAEMLEFAAILSHAACANKLVRSNIAGWAQVLHNAAVANTQAGSGTRATGASA